MICRILMACMLLGLSSAALGEVYRCEAGEVIEFSDRPCNGETALHEVERGISLVPADADLARLAEANKRFIEARRERLADRREQAAAEPQAGEAAEAAEPPVHTVLIPFRPPRHGRPVPRPEPTPETARDRRYSALNGPILGTRNRERWEPEQGRQ